MGLSRGCGRFTLILCAAVLGTALLAIGAEDKAKPEKAVPLPRSADDARRTYNAAVKRAYDEYLKQLDVAMRGATRAGDLEGALRIRDEIATLKEQRPAFMGDKPPVAPVGDNQAAGRLPAAAGRFEWRDVHRNSARVELPTLEVVPLAASGQKFGWQRVPQSLDRRGAVTYSKEIGKDAGYADFRVARAGLLVIACNFSPEGKDDGDWKKTRWTKEQFIENGWSLVSDEELGGAAPQRAGRGADGLHQGGQKERDLPAPL